MSLPSLSLKRPVFAIVMNIVIVIFGLVGFTFLGVRDFPAIDPPIVSVRTSYAGANSDIIETQITEPLEKQINGIAGIKNISSSSSQGTSNITVEFELGQDLEGATNDVRDKVSQALRQLPPDLRAALASLEQALHSPAEITRGEGLREAIAHSGLFLESTLARSLGQPPPALQDDWKAALLRLAATLDGRAPMPPGSAQNAGETPPPLLQRGLQAQPRAPLPELVTEDVTPLLGRLQGEVHAALARIEVAQLESGTGPLPAWMIEIPVHGEDGSDVLQVQLEYAVDDGDGSRGWNMGFALDLPALGAIQGELQLREPRLSVRLWAAQPDTVHLLERQFTALRQRLAACGLLLDQLTCQLGLPEPPNRYSAVLLQATA